MQSHLSDKFDSSTCRMFKVFILATWHKMFFSYFHLIYDSTFKKYFPSYRNWKINKGMNMFWNKNVIPIQQTSMLFSILFCRYCRKGSPLFISKPPSDVKQIVPPCSHCGSSRTFEFQLMPALVSLLRIYDPNSGECPVAIGLTNGFKVE